MTGAVTFERGLHELGDGAWAWLQPDGGWGWSNAGLITNGDASLLVDTLFDLRLTADMLVGMRAGIEPRRQRSTSSSTPTPTATTASATSSCATPRSWRRPRAHARWRRCPRRASPAWSRRRRRSAAWASSSPRSSGASSSTASSCVPPTTTFEGSLELRVGDRRVQLLELGPAHTAGDVAVHLPDAGIVFTGDLVFNGGHPIVWAGPVQHWIDACERLLALDATVVVPGHGPLSDRSCIEAEADYLRWLLAEGSPRLHGGMTPLDAAKDMAGGPYAGWGEGERLVVNLTAVARDMGLEPASDIVTLFDGMADLYFA